MTKRRINILFIIDALAGIGGTERHLTHLVTNLPKDEFNCAVMTFDIGVNVLVDSMRAAGIPVVHIPVGREYTPNALRGAMELVRFIREHEIDIVQTYHQKSDTFGALAARYAGVRHLVSSKRDMGQYRRIWHVALNRAVQPIFEKVIVVADAVGKMVMQKEGVPHSRMVRIYNGVDAGVFSPPSESQRNDARARLGISPADFVVGMVANFRPEKNHALFFTGAEEAGKKITGLKVIAVGGGPMLEHYRERYAAAEKDAQFRLPGAVSNVLEYLRAMDVACLVPGGNEGFSNAVIEKMAVGLPLVVSDVGGNAEAVRSGENGMVIRPDDRPAFVDALVALYADHRMRKQMGLKSRQRVEEEFSLESMCRSHEELYRSLVGPSAGNG